MDRIDRILIQSWSVVHLFYVTIYLTLTFWHVFSPSPMWKLFFFLNTCCFGICFHISPCRSLFASWGLKLCFLCVSQDDPDSYWADFNSQIFRQHCYQCLMLIASSSLKFLAAPNDLISAVHRFISILSLHGLGHEVDDGVPWDWKIFFQVWWARWSKIVPRNPRFGWTIATSPYMTVSEVIFRKDSS